MNQGAIANLIIGATIALLPLVNRVSVVDFARTGKDNLLVIIFAFLCFLLGDTKRKIDSSFYLALVYGLICLAFNHWNIISINVIMQSFYVGVGLIFFTTYHERHSGDGQHFILNGMALGCIIQVILVIASKLGFNLWAHLVGVFNDDINTQADPLREGLGSLGNPNLLASYIALTVPALFRKGWNYFVPFAVLTLLFSESAMGVISCLAGVAYLFNLKNKLIKKSYLYLGSAFFMVLAFFTGANGMDSKRFFGWSEMFKRVDAWHFLFGKGPGWFADNGVKLTVHELMTQEHNAYLSIFNMFGIIGILLLLPLFFKYLKTPDRSFIFPTILFTAFVNSYGHFTLHQSTVAIIIIVTAGICLAEGNNYVVNLER